jgi:hypothetical protein
VSQDRPRNWFEKRIFDLFRHVRKCEHMQIA